MRVMDLKVKGSPRKYVDVHIEKFNSCAEVVSVCRTRTCHNAACRHDDFFGKSTRPRNPDWSGFETVEEMEERLRTGLRDKTLLKEVSKFVHSARAPDIERYTTVKRDVYGGGVDVPRFLTGAPDCMVTMGKSKVKSDIIKVGVNTLVTAGISIERAKDVGAIIARCIYSIEKAGYRVQMDALTMHADCEKPYCTGMLVPIKKSDSTLSLPRLLYPLCDMSFSRGVSFGWVVQDPNLTPYDGLSKRVGWLFKDESYLSDMYAKILGPDAVYLDFNLLMDMYRSHDKEKSREELEKYIVTKFIGV